MASTDRRTARKFLSSYLPLIIWLAFITFASSDQFSATNTSRLIEPLVLWLFPNVSSETLSLIHFLTRKAAHFTEYGILAFLAARAFRASSNATMQRGWFLFSLLLVALYSLIDEYHQSFVPSRTSSIYDSMIDTVGGLTVLAIVYIYHASRSRRRAS